MSSVDSEVLADVAARMLEDAAFIFTVRAPGPAPWSETSLVAALTYAGPEHGELRLMTSAALASRLAANMLGVELDDPEVPERGADAVGEMLNVIAGALVARVFGTGVVCGLGVPRLSPAQPDGARGAWCSVDLLADDGEPLTLWIFAKES